MKNKIEHHHGCPKCEFVKDCNCPCHRKQKGCKHDKELFCEKCSTPIRSESINPQPEQEWEERLKILLGGYCYAQDGGSSGYDFEDIKAFIRTLLQKQESRLRAEWVEKAKELAQCKNVNGMPSEVISLETFLKIIKGN